MTYFIVEDDSAVADALSTLLRTARRDVYVFNDAESLMATARPTPADTVVVDLGLPGLSGGDLVSWLQQAPRGAPRIVPISGHGRQDIETMTRGLHLPEVLRKPPVDGWLDVLIR